MKTDVVTYKAIITYKKVKRPKAKPKPSMQLNTPVYYFVMVLI